MNTQCGSFSNPLCIDECVIVSLDLMQGGDLKFHLNKDEYFNEERSRFYAAKILLGLQHIHELGIIYRYGRCVCSRLHMLCSQRCKFQRVGGRESAIKVRVL